MNKTKTSGMVKKPENVNKNRTGSRGSSPARSNGKGPPSPNKSKTQGLTSRDRSRNSSLEDLNLKSSRGSSPSRSRGRNSKDSE